jgi:hypothetical protein
LYQIDNRLEDVALLPKAARALDAAFIPPHEQGSGSLLSVAMRPLRYARAAVRQVYHGSFLHDLRMRVRRMVNA